SHCQGFPANGDLLAWMQDHARSPSAVYVNRIGRTVGQVREERALRDALVAYLDANGSALAKQKPREVHEALCKFVAEETQAGRLTLTPLPPALPWKVGHILQGLGVLLVLILLAPLLLLILPVFLLVLRLHECRDPEKTPRPRPLDVARLAE